MKTLRTLVVLILGLALTIGVAASSAEPQSAVPIDIGTPGQVGHFVGTFTIGEFADQDGDVMARGLLSGELQARSGLVSVVKPASLPASALADADTLARLIKELLAPLVR